MKLVNDALIATSEDHHEVLDRHRSMSMPGSWTWPCGVLNPLPLEDGRRHDGNY